MLSGLFLSKSKHMALIEEIAAQRATRGIEAELAGAGLSVPKAAALTECVRAFLMQRPGYLSHAFQQLKDAGFSAEERADLIGTLAATINDGHPAP